MAQKKEKSVVRRRRHVAAEGGGHQASCTPFKLTCHQPSGAVSHLHIPCLSAPRAYYATCAGGDLRDPTVPSSVHGGAGVEVLASRAPPCTAPQELPSTPPLP